VTPRACVRVYARVLVLVPPNLYIHTYLSLVRGAGCACYYFCMPYAAAGYTRAELGDAQSEIQRLKATLAAR